MQQILWIRTHCELQLILCPQTVLVWKFKAIIHLINQVNYQTLFATRLFHYQTFFACFTDLMFFLIVPLELRDSVETFDLFMTSSWPDEYHPTDILVASEYWWKFMTSVIYLFWSGANFLKSFLIWPLWGQFNGLLGLTNSNLMSALWVRGSACIIFCLKGLVLLPGVFLFLATDQDLRQTLKIWVLFVVIVVFTS